MVSILLLPPSIKADIGACIIKIRNKLGHSRPKNENLKFSTFSIYNRLIDITSRKILLYKVGYRAFGYFSGILAFQQSTLS
jgi:hypothetical protein